MRTRKRHKRHRSGFLFDLAQASTQEIRTVIPVEAEVIGKISQLPDVLPHCEPGFHVTTEGEGGYRDERSFAIHDDGNGGWTMVSSWRAKGDGPPPFFLELLGSMAPLFSRLFDFGLRKSHPVIRQMIGRETDKESPGGPPWGLQGPSIG